MMISTLKWREEFKVDELVNEEFPQDIFGPVGHIFGKDRDGRPVTYGSLACTPTINSCLTISVKLQRLWRKQGHRRRFC